jgi:hypothetical protein
METLPLEVLAIILDGVITLDYSRLCLFVCLLVSKQFARCITYYHPDELYRFSQRWASVNAVKLRSYSLLKWCHQNGYPLTSDTFIMAVRKQNLEILEYLHLHHCPVLEKDRKTIRYIAQHKQKTVLDFLMIHEYINNKMPRVSYESVYVIGYQIWQLKYKITRVVEYDIRFTTTIINSPISYFEDKSNKLCLYIAFYTGRTDILELLLKRDRSIFVNSVLQECKFTDDKYSKSFMELYKQGWGSCYRLNREGKNLISIAASRGDVRTLEHFKQSGVALPEDQQELCAYYAAKYGHLNVLMWLQKNKLLRLDGCICKRAAQSGYFRILEWLHSQDCPWDCSEDCSWNCPWDARTPRELARLGLRDMLEWAHSNGCKWDYNTVRQAQINGHTRLARWAVESGCPLYHTYYSYDQSYEDKHGKGSDTFTDEDDIDPQENELYDNEVSFDIHKNRSPDYYLSLTNTKLKRQYNHRKRTQKRTYDIALKQKKLIESNI